MSTHAIPIHNFSEDDATSIPFKLIPLEQKSEYDTSVPHRHNYYEIFVFGKGGGVHDIDFETFDIETGSLHYVSPGQVHHVERALDSYGYVILFSRDFYSLNIQNKDILFELPFLNNNSSRPILNLKSDDFKNAMDAILKMETEYGSDNPMKEEFIRSYLNILLIHSKRMFEQYHPNVGVNDTSSASQFQNFKILLEKNFAKLHKVKEYAQLMTITEKQLNEVIKKAVGKTASELIQSRLILEAKRLFMHSDYSNKEIAYFLNFEDPSHFSKFFKKRVGMSPNDFRKSLTERYDLK
jgi:AraC family transcriptional activator of pobA